MAHWFGKVATGIRVFQDKGLAGVSSLVRQTVGPTLRRRPGNLVVIDGCTISLDGVSEQVRHWLLTGEYEASERSLLRRLDWSLPVVELGGSLGVVACIANKLLTDRAQHLVVEANSDLIPQIEENRRRNNCGFQVVNAAIAYGQPTVDFPVSENSLESSIYMPGQRTVSVPATSLEELHRKVGFTRFNLICDIEGAEVELVDQEQEFLERWVDTIIMEVHPDVATRLTSGEVLSTLRLRGFKTLQSDRDTLLLQHDR
jgi:FkbM family methyltransferase